MEARYIYIFSGNSNSYAINLLELRIFGSQSLTKTATVVRSLPNDPGSPNLIAQNLVNNIDNWSLNSNRQTFNYNGNAISGTYYCYKVDAADLYTTNNGLYELTL